MVTITTFKTSYTDRFMMSMSYLECHNGFQKCLWFVECCNRFFGFFVEYCDQNIISLEWWKGQISIRSWAMVEHDKIANHYEANTPSGKSPKITPCYLYHRTHPSHSQDIFSSFALPSRDSLTISWLCKPTQVPRKVPYALSKANVHQFPKIPSFTLTYFPNVLFTTWIRIDLNCKLLLLEVSIILDGKRDRP